MQMDLPSRKVMSQQGNGVSAVIKLDASTDFNSMKVSQLKQILQDRGASCRQCVEKQDYVKQVKSLISPGSGEL